MKKWERFTLQEIEQYVKESCSWTELAKKLGYNKNGGSTPNTLNKMVQELKLDVTHFTGSGWKKNKFDYERFRNGKAIKIANALNALVSLRGHKCEDCHLDSWLGHPIPLEIHHIDGDSLNNEIENLKLLCPNCHALTNNYRGKNINQGRRQISDEDFINSLQRSQNIRQALKSLGLTAKGGNYQRARELIHTYNIEHLL